MKINSARNKFYLKWRFVYLLSFLFLVSCGQTGPLTLPTPESEKPQKNERVHLPT